jgi:transposase-like protein
MVEGKDQGRQEASNQNGRAKSEVPDPEVTPSGRRRFTAAYKLSILAEAEGCREPGEVGALLRREGLYSSHLSKWREQRRQGELAGLEAKKRGRPSDPQAEEIERLRRENERLKRQLARAEVIIEAQKKRSQRLMLPSSEVS